MCKHDYVETFLIKNLWPLRTPSVAPVFFPFEIAEGTKEGEKVASAADSLYKSACRWIERRRESTAWLDGQRKEAKKVKENEAKRVEVKGAS